MRRHPATRRVAALALAAAAVPLGLLVPPTARADPTPVAAPQTVVFGGVDASSASQYAYLGAVRPFAGGTLGQGPFLRLGASALGYRYDAVIDGRTERVQARAPGAELALGWAFGTPRAGGDVSLGLGVRRVRLSPDDPGAGVRGTRFFVSPQLALAARPLERLDAEVLASAASGLHSRFVRARLGWRVAEGWRLGHELQLGRGPDYRDQRAGLFVAVTVPGGWMLGLQAGRARDREGRHDGYAGLSFSHAD